MGGTQSTTCKSTLQNPDLLNVVTLSDSAVQRLPLEIDDNPLDKEQRNQNIDDYWRERLDCLETTYGETKRMTEKEFRRLEFTIKKMAPEGGKLACPRMVEDTSTCYLIFGTETLKCTHLVDKFKLCMDTMSAETLKRRYLDDMRKAKKGPC
ncbi:hypothetical protein RUM44_008990 [Polyplax serrata]|uniref:COX assembly mitochondrial protein n=1 Tax=Polyplax serrata TaxID=468196 RepID=A0ABR1ARE7_POLSC